MGLLQKAKEQSNSKDLYQKEPNKLEEKQYAYEKILQIFREILLAENEEKIYKTLALSLTGFFGPLSLAIFVARKNRYVHVYSQGFYHGNKDTYPQGHLPEILLEKPTVHLVEKILGKLSQEERYFCEVLKHALVIPGIFYGKLKGFLFLKTNKIVFQGEEELFLQVFSSSLGIFLHIADFIYGIEKERKINQNRKERQALFNEIIFTMSLAQEKYEVEKLLKEILVKEFGITKFILYQRNVDTYVPLLSDGFSEPQRFLEISYNEPRLQEISLFRGWKGISLTSWRSFLEGYLKINIDEFTNDIEILPLYHKGSLEGFFLLFAVKEKLAGDDRFFLQGILQFAFSFFASKKEEAKDVLEFLREKLAQYEQALEAQGENYVGVFLQITNLHRLEAIFGSQEVISIRQKSKEIIKNFLHEEDFLLEFLPGYFFFFSQKWDYHEAVLLVHKIQSQINALHPKEELAPLVRSRFFCRPKDPIPELSHFLQI